MNYRVTHAPIWDIHNVQRGVVVADNAEQAKQIFIVSGCEVMEVEELHAIEEAYKIEQPTEAEAQAAEVERDNKWLDSDTVREDWQADAIAEAEFDADTKWTQECAL